MFERDRNVEIASRRAGRIAFGLVLIAGAVLLVFNALHEVVIEPAVQVPLTWVCAFLVAGIVRLATRRPLPADRLRARFAPSIVVPSIGIALMAPLSIHLPVVSYLFGVDAYRDWVEISILVTGLTHVVTATLVGLRAGQLVAGHSRPVGMAAVYLTGVGVSCVPFALLYMIPPAIVAVTGLALFPLLVYQRRIVEREQTIDVDLPCARLVMI
jgi:hypothetical protein